MPGGRRGQKTLVGGSLSNGNGPRNRCSNLIIKLLFEESTVSLPFGYNFHNSQPAASTYLLGCSTDTQYINIYRTVWCTDTQSVHVHCYLTEREEGVHVHCYLTERGGGTCPLIPMYISRGGALQVP
uniref:Uncharacterized protein n=1 Tax=Salmo trutta TaxID=8032 RepID=A0A673XJI4_SALTR